MVPQRELIGASGVQGDRAVEAYTGAVLGGTSRINQMLYTRGLPDEYDRWEREAGMEGWGWDTMQGYFLKSEKSESAVEGVHSQDGVWKNKLHTSFYFKGFTEYVPSLYARCLSSNPHATSSAGLSKPRSLLGYHTSPT